MPRGNDPHRRQRSSAGCVTARPPRKIRELRASLFELVFPVARSGTAEHTALCYPVETELGKVARIDSCTTPPADRKSTRLNSSHANISYAVFCLKKKKRCTCSSATPARYSPRSSRQQSRRVGRNTEGRTRH